MPKTSCRVCQIDEPSQIFPAREMMLGLKTTFDYFECGKCGSIQICDVPEDLSKYYPTDYYAFQASGCIKARLKTSWARFSLLRRGILGRLIAGVVGTEQAIDSLRSLKLSASTYVLDVGCGRGELIRALHSLGFQRLKGIDPYNTKDIIVSNNVSIERKSLNEVEDQFDIVMLHHSFEHMNEPRKVFEDCARVLRKGGVLLIRSPVAGCFVWKQYGSDWVQLDAPRHLFIPSVKAMSLLAESVGLIQQKTVFDSTEFQFWGSEQYRKGISLADKRSHHRNPLNLLLPSEKIKDYHRRAEELNRNQEGDSACFYFQKK